MFLTKTTELAIQSLVFFATQNEGMLCTPQDIAEPLEESPSYLSKVLRILAKAGILRSQRGKSGGFLLARRPEDISLLMVVEACQGMVVGNYCSEAGRSHLKHTCRYHQAMQTLQDGIRQTLSGTSIAELCSPPGKPSARTSGCKLFRACGG